MLDKEYGIRLKWNSRNKNKFVKLGYNFTKMGDEFIVKEESQLSKNSKAVVKVNCDYCDNYIFKTYQNYLKQHHEKYGDACRQCQPKKLKLIWQEKYGVDNVFQLEKVKEKSKQTCLEKYGMERACQSEEVKESIRQSCLDKYGYTTTALVPEIIEKRIQTTLERFGVENVFASEEIKDKIRETMNKNGTCRTSKPQLALYDMLKNFYGNCELNYPCGKYSLDCMVEVNNIKFDIEFDCWYWHQNIVEHDKKCDGYVKYNGYKIIRIWSGTKLPTIEQIDEIINNLSNSKEKYYKINMV